MAGYVPDIQSRSWVTPEHVLRSVRKALKVDQIDLDPCANAASLVYAKVQHRLPVTNGLKVSWDYPTIFVNPPYGTTRVHRTTNEEFRGKWSDLTEHEKLEYDSTTIAEWLFRCCQAHIVSQSEVIALVPVTPETEGWRKWVFTEATAICFFNRRITFIDPETKLAANSGFPKPQCLIYWGSNYDNFAAALSNDGTVIPVGKELRCIGY